MNPMQANKEQLWQAYIDGELPATEMAAFEESLSATERRALANDVQFDRALSQRLAQDAECPDEVWARTKALLESHAEDSNGDSPKNVVPLRRPWFPNIATIVAAAGITLMVSWFLPFITGRSTAPVILAEETVSELAAQSELNDPTLEQIQQYMQQHNYKMHLVAIETLRVVQVHKNVKLLGVSRSNNGDIAELYVACCNQPVKIILAERSTSEARAISRALGQDNDLQDVRLVDNYVAGVVSKHPAVGLLDIFASQHI